MSDRQPKSDQFDENLVHLQHVSVGAAKRELTLSWKLAIILQMTLLSPIAKKVNVKGVINCYEALWYILACSN